MLGLDQDIIDQRWDLIFVDGPPGWCPTCAGRAQSIYAAACLALLHLQQGPVHVFVHDYNRRLEAAYANKLLGNMYLLETHDAPTGNMLLAHFVLNSTHAPAVFCTGYQSK
eukprot:gene6336-155_t